MSDPKVTAPFSTRPSPGEIERGLRIQRRKFQRLLLTFPLSTSQHVQLPATRPQRRRIQRQLRNTSGPSLPTIYEYVVWVPDQPNKDEFWGACGHRQTPVQRSCVEKRLSPVQEESIEMSVIQGEQTNALDESFPILHVHENVERSVSEGGGLRRNLLDQPLPPIPTTQEEEVEELPNVEPEEEVTERKRICKYTQYKILLTIAKFLSYTDVVVALAMFQVGLLVLLTYYEAVFVDETAPCKVTKLRRYPQQVQDTSGLPWVILYAFLFSVSSNLLQSLVLILGVHMRRRAWLIVWLIVQTMSLAYAIGAYFIYRRRILVVLDVIIWVSLVHKCALICYVFYVIDYISKKKKKDRTRREEAV